MRNTFIFLSIITLTCIFLNSCKPEEIDTSIVGEVTIDVDANKNTVRKIEALLGNMLCDGNMLFAKDSLSKNPDFAIFNGGNIRFNDETSPSGIYKAGKYTEDDILEILYYDGNLYLIELTGEQLKEILERSVASLPDEAKGWFLQCSKELNYTANLSEQGQIIDETDPDNITISTPGERITSIKINGQDYNLETKYSIIVPNYIGDGEDGFVTFANIDASLKEDLGDYRIAFTYYFKKYSPITPELDGRITINN